MNINEVKIGGRIVADPKLKYTPSSMAVIELRIATNRKTKDKKETEYHSVVFFAKAAETLSKWVCKGNRIFVAGRLQTRDYDAKDGSKRYKTEIIGSTFEFIDTVNDKSSGNESKQSENSDVPKQTLANSTLSEEVKAKAEMMYDDIPF